MPMLTVGTLLRLIERLPKSTRPAIYKHTGLKENRLSEFETFNRDLINRTKPKESIDKAKNIIKNLIECLRANQFFCENDRGVMRFFMQTMVQPIIEGDKEDKNRSMHLCWTSIPFFKSIGSDEHPFLRVFYECLEKLVEFSIFRDKAYSENQPEALYELNQSNSRLDTDYWRNMCQIYKRTLQAYNRNVNLYTIYIEEKLKLSTMTGLIDETAKGEHKKNSGYENPSHDPKSYNEFYDRFVPNQLDERRVLFSKAKKQKRENLIQSPAQALIHDGRTEIISLRENPTVILRLSYGKIISYSGAEREYLTRSMFEIENVDNHIALSSFADIEEIQRNKEFYWLMLEQSSVESGYLPISYQKVHITSLKKKDIDPEMDSMHKWEMCVCGIGYFDHLILRNHFSGAPEFGGPPRKEIVEKYLDSIFLSPYGFKKEDFPADFMLAGCGVWVVSKDNYIMLSLRQGVNEKPDIFGYSAAGSCEFTSRMQMIQSANKLEADPFLTMQRELEEECGIRANMEDLRLVGFGIDFERYLQQFSFLHFADLYAFEILQSAKEAKSNHEQTLFAIPFSKEILTSLLVLFELEPGAAASLAKIITAID